MSCELVMDQRRVDVHVLGYWVDEDDAPLEELLRERRRAREQRLVRVLEGLAAAGVVVDEQRVRAVAGDAPVGRPHIARVLVEMGVAASVAEAFERFLVPGRPGYVPRQPLPPARAFAAIREAGGVPVLAHPGLMPSDVLRLLPQWKSQGLAGLEVYHTKHTPAQSRMYLRLAAQYGLAPSGGSDCHGPQPDGPPLMGRVRVPMEWVDRLREQASRR